MLRNLDPVDLGQQVVVKTNVAVNRQRYEDRAEAEDVFSKPAEEWTDRDLRLYVVTEIERRFGKWERNFVTEASTFKRFHKDWGVRGVKMAQYLFDTLDGWWQGQPVTVNRFCRGADPYFAVPLADRMGAVG